MVPVSASYPPQKLSGSIKTPSPRANPLVRASALKLACGFIEANLSRESGAHTFVHASKGHLDADIRRCVMCPLARVRHDQTAHLFHDGRYVGAGIEDDLHASGRKGIRYARRLELPQYEPAGVHIEVARERSGERCEQRGELLEFADGKMRRSKADSNQCITGLPLIEMPANVAKLIQRHIDHPSRRLALKRCVERPRFRCDSDAMKKRYRTARSRGCSERLQLVLGGIGRQTIDGRNARARDFAKHEAERSEEHIAAGKRAEIVNADQDPGRPIFGDMQAGVGCPARDRGGEIEEVAVSAGAGAQDRIREYDGVGFGPGYLVSKLGTMLELIRRACEARLASQFNVRFHEPFGGAPSALLSLIQLGMDQVERADVQRRGHGYPRFTLDESFDEIEACRTVIKTTVYMRRRDIDQPVSAHDVRRARDDPHGQRGTAAHVCVQHCGVSLTELQHD